MGGDSMQLMGFAYKLHDSIGSRLAVAVVHDNVGTRFGETASDTGTDTLARAGYNDGLVAKV